jgi:signal transduction histidine kinase
MPHQPVETTGVIEDLVAGARAPATTRAFLGALLDGDAAAGAELGRELALGGASPGEAARETIRLTDGLEAALEARGAMDASSRLAYRGVAGAALAAAMDAHAAVLLDRRDGWLSHYTHELRNPLKTLVNALWLLRHGEKPGQQQRVCDMADRAVTRLEKLIKEVRELEGKFPTEPPARGGSRP